MERKRKGMTGSSNGATAVLERGPDAIEQVRETAYKLFQKRGYAHGNDWKDWFEAEKKVYKNIQGR